MKFDQLWGFSDSGGDESVTLDHAMHCDPEDPDMLEYHCRDVNVKLHVMVQNHHMCICIVVHVMLQNKIYVHMLKSVVQ